MQYLRKNFILSGWICFVLGTGVFFSGMNGAPIVIGTTISLAGLILIFIGISSKDQGLTPNQIEAWMPSRNDLDEPNIPNFENKKIKFRIDTTLDEPIKTSILCGNCSELTIIENIKPNFFKCPNCKIELWNEEE